MSIEELFSERSIHEVLKSLKELGENLNKVTLPIRTVMNPKMKSEQELFERVKELRIEVDDLVKEVESKESKKDLKLIKKITEKVKSIVEEKRRIQEELKLLRMND